MRPITIETLVNPKRGPTEMSPIVAAFVPCIIQSLM